MKQKIIEEIQKSISTKKLILNNEHLIAKIEEVSRIITNCFQNKRKILIFGNGGSACDAQHMAGEFVGRFLKERSALAAIALTADSAVLTCLSNDYGYINLFSRQVEALANPGDVLFGISTSGNSENVLKAFDIGKQIKTINIALLGNDGGAAIKYDVLPIIVPSNETPHIQEAHIMIIHLICNIVEENLFNLGDKK